MILKTLGVTLLVLVVTGLIAMGYFYVTVCGGHNVIC